LMSRLHMRTVAGTEHERFQFQRCAESDEGGVFMPLRCL
jgi:hypothetical protein